MEHSNYQIFKQLHYNKEPLLIPNAWDAKSAKTFQESGFEAVATSSAALANVLGYEDGEQIPFSELLFIVQRICQSTKLLVSVDIEGGYSRNPSKICEHIERLSQLGVVGINIEDSIIDGQRKLLDPSSFSKTIEQIKSFCLRKEIDIFLNLRTDTYLLNVENRLEKTLERIEIYENAGVDGVFIPCLTSLEEMNLICQKTPLPINVMCMPDLPSFGYLSKAGIKRISMGPFMFEFLSKQQSLVTSRIREEGSFKSLF
ncbi:isocitrate lyase/phosphoenolpyruvate mutase family protein [bacterium]|nr:isocitrate lyase/phosphoenolpyruvate mutase family protein [bacterium]MCI0612506.1 isocitrate lyase/phosphoenolpyruvate mutase family protein [bacterium]